MMGGRQFTQRRRLPLWRKVAAVFVGVITLTGFYILAFGSVALNGTSSLPHNGYVMTRWPILPWRGAYVSFEAPDGLIEEAEGFSFIKRVAGLPGDVVSVEGQEVCVHGACRLLLTDLVDRGITAIEAGVIPEDSFLVFGDAENSLDSRYARIGLIDRARIEAIGIPAPIPHWKEIHAWFTSDS